MRKEFITILILITCISGISSCKKFLDVGTPKTEAASSDVFMNESTATVAMLSVYGDFMKGASSINASSMLSQSADELANYSTPPAVNYYANNLNYIDNNDFWSLYYQVIYQANAVWEGVNASAALGNNVKMQLSGEALFVRAFFHFYLVNLFGDIPYQTTTNYKVLQAAGRTPVTEVYESIIRDLKAAKQMLGDQFLNAANQPGVERVRPNKSAAHAMLARVYLYRKDWRNAILEADSVISNTTTYKLLTDLNQVFKKNSQEAIWQMMPGSPVNTNGFEGPAFIMNFPPSVLQPLAMSNQLWNAFEANDKRKQNWTGNFLAYHYPYKYKVKATGQPVTEYPMVLRLAELYLVKAEALAQEDELAAAIDNVDSIRNRAGLPLLSTTSPAIGKEELLIAIQKERNLELFTEWGHRWLDLKRTGKADEVLGPLKGDNWQSTDQLFPIPKTQMDLAPAFKGKQNPGYDG